MTSPVNVLRLGSLTPEERRRCLARTENDLTPFLEKVGPIIEAVAAEGDEALARFTRQFDKAPVTADRLSATPDDFIRARKSLDADIIEAISFASGYVNGTVFSRGTRYENRCFNPALSEGFITCPRLLALRP